MKNISLDRLEKNVKIVTLESWTGKDRHMSICSCRCPAPGCKYKIVVEKRNRDEVLVKIYSGVENHLTKSHPDFPVLAMDRIFGYVKKMVGA